jgi:hypothetical protein
LPERSGWSSPGCRDRQGTASEHLIPCRTSLVILAILAAMILGMSHRHDRRNHSRHDVRRDHRHHRHDLPGHWHYPGDDPRQPSEMIDHQNHSRADHHDGAPGTIPMTIHASFPTSVMSMLRSSSESEAPAPHGQGRQRATRSTASSSRKAIMTPPTTAFSAPEKSCHGHKKRYRRRDQRPATIWVWSEGII